MSSALADDDATPAPRPLTGGAVMGAASRLVVAITGAATTILIARLFGDAGTGAFAVALTIVYVLTVLCTLGVEHGIAYYVSGRTWGPRHAFATSQRVAIVVGLAGAGLGVAVRLAIPSIFADLSVAECAIAAGALPFALAWFYGAYVALADDHYEGYVLPPAVQSGSLLVLVVALALPFGITGAVIALFAAHALTATVFHVRSRRRFAGRVESDPEPGQLRRALAFGVKGYAGNALQVFNYRVDLLLLSAVATTAVVGQYAVAVAVTTVLWLLPQSISDVLFPRVAALSSAGEGDADAHRAFVETKSLRHVTLIALLAAGVLALALVFLVVPVYGPDFEASTELGLIRLPGVVLIGIGGVLSATIVGRGRPQYMLYSALISTPLTMVLYAVLIPRWEATGAALASSLSFAMNFVLATYFYRRTTGINPLRLMWPTRSELADYRGLPSQIAAWARGLRG